MLELRLLGGLSLTDADGQSLCSVLAQPKRVALLAYLAIARPRGFHRRDTLLALFWPELDGERGRAALSQAVYYLRRSLGSDAVESRGNDELRVDAGRVWCDVIAFESAVEAGEHGRALDLYRGGPMPGFHLEDTPSWERWLDAERMRLRTMAAYAAWTAADAALAAGRSSETARLGRRAFALMPNDEAGLRQLITLFSQIGDRAAAIQAYEEAAERMDRDLGVRPSAETERLVADIRSRKAGPASPDDVSDSVPGRHSPAEVGSPESDGAPAPRPGGRYRFRRPGLLLATAAGVAAVLLAGLSVLQTETPAPARTADVSAVTDGTLRRVAVLPFDELSADTADAYLAAGTGEELRGRLARLGDVLVIARSSVARYRDTELGAREIGAQLDVGTLIEGTARKSGDRVRVTVQIVDAASETTIWSREFEGGAQEILELQARIAEGVARGLGLSLREDDRRRLATSGTSSAEAFRRYLAGRERLGRADPDGVRAARVLFGQAIAADSGFARAWAGLADVFDELAGMGVLPADDAYPRSRAMAEAALERDPGLAEAHASLGHALNFFYWDSELAERHFRRAIELDPSDARARRVYASHLRNGGRYVEARREAEAALALAPRDFFAGSELALIAHFAGRYEDAVELASRVVAQGPEFRYANVFVALALAQLGRYDEALEALAALGPLASLSDPLTIRGYVLARAGRDEEAREALAGLRERASGGTDLAFGRAVVHVGLGNREAALDLLEQAADARDWHMRLIGGEPIFDPLRTHPRFEAVLARVGLAE